MNHPVRFNPWRLAQLSSFRIGSAMVEILATSIWNRIMISTLGLPATLVGFLLALRYFLAPLSVWVGHRSDNVPLWGYYRTSYIWLGRGLTLLSLPLLPLSLARLELNDQDPAGWGLAFLCFVLYAFGSVFTGSPYLALVRDSAPAEKQGVSISTTETVFIILIAFTGIGFAQWMSEYRLEIFWQMVLGCLAAGALFWFAGVYGVESASISPAERAKMTQAQPAQPSFIVTFRHIWSDHRTRAFFFFLGLSTLSAWSQDAILEPFGGDVLGLGISATTRFNSYWQGATVLTLVGGAFIWRKQRPEEQTGLTWWGLVVMSLGMWLIAVESFLVNARLITPALLVFGAGFGLYTFGSLNLMGAMASDRMAGAYLGLWTISILLFKGLGTFLGGALRDLFLWWGFTDSWAYGTTFALASVGLMASLLFLNQAHVQAFVRDQTPGRAADSLPITVDV